MKLAKYIRENNENQVRSQKIDSKTWIDIFRKKCTESHDKVIFRGLESASDFSIIRPSLFTRQSKNTENYYTLLIDNLPSWNDYPKRSKSVICSTDDAQAYNYGDVYRVFPFNGSNIGICSDCDMWLSFRTLNGNSLNMFNHHINALCRAFNETKPANNVSSYSDLVKIFKKISDKINSLDDKERIATVSDLFYIYSFVKYIEKGGDLLDYIEKMLNPSTNGFDHVKIKDFDNPKHREVWTDGDCLLISIESFRKLKAFNSL